ncbi:MAG: YcaO-like family protein [Haloquadratum sp.]|nr:YcaO-like family protein [Haloquadratum sp.]
MSHELSVTAAPDICALLAAADVGLPCHTWDDQPPIEHPGQLLVGRSPSAPDAGAIACCPTVPPAVAYERGLEPVGEGAPASMRPALAGLARLVLAADDPLTDRLLILHPDGRTEASRLLPRPLPRDPPGPTAVVTEGLEAAITAAEVAVDATVGIIEAVGEEASTPLPYYLARVSTHPMSHAHEQGLMAAGVDLNWDRAYMRALGEALERYAASVYDVDALQTAPPETITPALSLEALARPDEPLPASLPWVTGLDLHTRSATAVPAGLVYHPPPGPQLRPPITTGLALARSRERAIHGGLLEVIERDAIMCAWYGEAPVHRVTVGSEAMQTLSTRLRAADLTVTCWATPTAVGVPVCIAAVHRAAGYPRCAFGSAAAVEPEAAARHAVIEATQNWMEIDAMGAETTAETYDGVARYASDPAPAFDALPGPGGAVAIESVLTPGPTTLDPLIDALADEGLAAVAVSVTTGDLRAMGFEAVRALIPAAQPLFVREPYFGDRVGSDAHAVHTRRPHPFP